VRFHSITTEKIHEANGKKIFVVIEFTAIRIISQEWMMMRMIKGYKSESCCYFNGNEKKLHKLRQMTLSSLLRKWGWTIVKHHVEEVEK
jgi:hypothetical protein